MAMYEYVCKSHGKFTAWSSMADRHKAQACPKCGKLSSYTISAPRVFSDFAPYESPASGKIISGRRERIEDLARTGCRPYEEGEMKDFESRQRLAEAKQEAEIDEVVERTITDMTL